MTTPTQPWRPDDTLAARLVLIRRQLGLSQRAAAAQTGVSFGSWQSMEDGRSPHNLLDKIQRICDTWHVDRDWLLWGGALDHSHSHQTSTQRESSSPLTREYLTESRSPEVYACAA